MKLTLNEMKKIISEELKKFLKEQEIEEGWAIKKQTKRAPGQGAGFRSLKPPKYMSDPNDAGKAHKEVMNGEKLEGWDKYAQLVAEAYEAAPEKDPKAAAIFERLGHHILMNFPKVASSYNVKFVDGQPYDTAGQMATDMKKTGVMKVSKDFNQSEIFGELENLYFRAVHDYYGHLQAKGFEKDTSKITKFNLEGELRAYNNHAKMLRGSELLKAIYTEVLGQACYFMYYGKFPDQKAILMDDMFDHENIGRVKGYQIIDGDLVKEGAPE
jgi:hypothetical protein